MNVSRETILPFIVSRETITNLSIYEDLLKKWNQKINLVSQTTLPLVWERHFYDSLQLMEYLIHKNSCIVDLGTGAGFPGLILACAGYSNIQLVEVDERKGVFLREVARVLNLPVTVHTCRIQDYAGPKAEIVTARALAPLEKLIEYGKDMVIPSGKGLFLKGERYMEEINALQDKKIDLKVFKSKIKENSVIIEVQY